MGERLALVQPLLAAVARHVDEHPAPDDAPLGDRHDRRPAHPAAVGGRRRSAPFQSVSSYQAWPSASYCDEPCRNIVGLVVGGADPAGELGPLPPGSNESWSQTISRWMPSRPGKTGSPWGCPIGHCSVWTSPLRTLPPRAGPGWRRGSSATRPRRRPPTCPSSWGCRYRAVRPWTALRSCRSSSSRSPGDRHHRAPRRVEGQERSRPGRDRPRVEDLHRGPGVARRSWPDRPGAWSDRRVRPTPDQPAPPAPTGLLPGVRSAFTDARLRTHHLEAGPETGDPVVLVHGNLSTGRFYEHLMPGARRPLAGARPGHARVRAQRPRPAGRDPRARRLGRRPRRLLRALGITAPPHLVGWSTARRGDRRARAAAAGGVADVPRPGVALRLRRRAPRRPPGVRPDFAGSGAGGANPEFVRRLAEGDRSGDSPFSPRSVMTHDVLVGGFRLPREREDVLVAEILLGRDRRRRLPRRRARVAELARLRPGHPRHPERALPEVLHWSDLRRPRPEAPGAVDPRDERPDRRRRLDARVRHARRGRAGARLAGRGRLPAAADGHADPRRAGALRRGRRPGADGESSRAPVTARTWTRRRAGRRRSSRSWTRSRPEAGRAAGSWSANWSPMPVRRRARSVCPCAPRSTKPAPAAARRGARSTRTRRPARVAVADRGEVDDETAGRSVQRRARGRRRAALGVVVEIAVDGDHHLAGVRVALVATRSGVTARRGSDGVHRAPPPLDRAGAPFAAAGHAQTAVVRTGSRQPNAARRRYVAKTR